MADPQAYEIVELRRNAAGEIEGVVRYASGLEVIRPVKGIEIEAKVVRGPESHAMGLDDEDLGLVAATYTDPVKEAMARVRGLGTPQVDSCV